MKGIVVAILFGLFGVVFAIVAMATPMYTVSRDDINYEAYPFKICGGSENRSGCKTINDDGSGLTDSQKSVFRFICALLIFYFLTSLLGIAAGVLERFGRARKIHLMILFVVAAFLAFLSWVVMVGNFHKGESVNPSETWSDIGFKLSASPAIMIVSWLACMAGVVVAWKVKGREDEGESPGSGFTQGRGYKFSAV